MDHGCELYVHKKMTVNGLPNIESFSDIFSKDNYCETLSLTQKLKPFGGEIRHVY